MEKNIKDYRDKELKTFIFGNILFILLGTSLIDNIVEFLGVNSVWLAVGELFGSSVLCAFIYIFVFVFDSVIPGNIKNNILWPVSGLPGNRIFSDIKKKNKDERFLTVMALDAYKDVYKMIEAESEKKKKAKIQNSAWYKLYSKHENCAQVYIAHRDFLLCRDMTIMMIWIIIDLLLLSWYTGQPLSFKMITFLIIEFIALWLSARIKGSRFVYNVIAKDLAEFEEEKKTNILMR